MQSIPIHCVRSPASGRVRCHATACANPGGLGGARAEIEKGRNLWPAPPLKRSGVDALFFEDATSTGRITERRSEYDPLGPVVGKCRRLLAIARNRWRVFREIHFALHFYSVRTRNRCKNSSCIVSSSREKTPMKPFSTVPTAGLVALCLLLFRAVPDSRDERARCSESCHRKQPPSKTRSRAGPSRRDGSFARRIHRFERRGKRRGRRSSTTSTIGCDENA